MDVQRGEHPPQAASTPLGDPGQGFALHRLSSVGFSKQGEALRSAFHSSGRMSLLESTLASVTTRVQGGALRYEACNIVAARDCLERHRR